MRLFNRGEEFLTSTVVECKCQNQSVVTPRAVDRSTHCGLKLRIEPLKATDVAQLRPLPV